MANGASVLELRDIVWAHPIMVSGPKPVDVALVATGDEQIAYEIYSADEGQQTIHGQGRAVLCAPHDVAPLSVETLRNSSREERLIRTVSMRLLLAEASSMARRRTS